MLKQIESTRWHAIAVLAVALLTGGMLAAAGALASGEPYDPDAKDPSKPDYATPYPGEAGPRLVGHASWFAVDECRDGRRLPVQA